MTAVFKSDDVVNCFENEFGRIETGFRSSENENVQIVKYAGQDCSTQFISTLGLSDVNINSSEGRFEWFMEIAPDLPIGNAASVMDHFLSLYLVGKLSKVLRGSYIEFPNANDRIWEEDNSNGLYFTTPISRTPAFQDCMRKIGIVPIWVIPITISEVALLDKAGWKALENYWDERNTNLLSTYRS